MDDVGKLAMSEGEWLLIKLVFNKLYFYN
jgi:hypothetical protein